VLGLDFSVPALDEIWLDWGDVPVDCTLVHSFEIGYATSIPGRVHAIDVVFYESDDGFCDSGRSPNTALRLTGLPGQFDAYTGWLISVIPATPIDLSTAADLDGDGKRDFSYSFHMRTPRDNISQLTGPLIAGGDQPSQFNCPHTPGAEDAFDIYAIDPNDPPGPNDLLLPDINTLCAGTTSFGGAPFAQFYMGLVRQTCSACPGDVEPVGGDGDIDLTDLAILLAHYGDLGVTCHEGDVEPFPGGDGDVDLSDLAVLLSTFGGSCESGICCMPAGDCAEVTRAECDLLGGSFAPGGTCSPVSFLAPPTQRQCALGSIGLTRVTRLACCHLLGASTSASDTTIRFFLNADFAPPGTTAAQVTLGGVTLSLPVSPDPMNYDAAFDDCFPSGTPFTISLVGGPPDFPVLCTNSYVIP
jgi:hypothetical protein